MQDPTQLPSLSKQMDMDDGVFSELERKALAGDHVGTEYFKEGVKPGYIDEGRLSSAINAWGSFESYA